MVRSCDDVEPGFLPYRWSSLPQYLQEKGREITQVVGNGFCLLKAILTGLRTDHCILYTEEHLIRITNAHLQHHANQYILFHEDSEEALKEAVDELFASRQFNTTVVDLLVKIFIDALFVNIAIYKNMNGQIELDIYKSENGTATKTVYVQFTRSGETDM